MVTFHNCPAREGSDTTMLYEIFHRLQKFEKRYPHRDISSLTLDELNRLIAEEGRKEYGNPVNFSADRQCNRS